MHEPLIMTLHADADVDTADAVAPSVCACAFFAVVRAINRDPSI